MVLNLEVEARAYIGENNLKHLVKSFVIFGLSYDIWCWFCLITCALYWLEVSKLFEAWILISRTILWVADPVYHLLLLNICNSESLRCAKIHHCHVTWYIMVVYSRCYHKLELFLLLKQNPNIHLADSNMGKRWSGLSMLKMIGEQKYYQWYGAHQLLGYYYTVTIIIGVA